MRLRFGGLLLSLGVSLGLGLLPAQAQVADRQVGALVDALRQAAPQTGTEDDGLYSPWQIKPENIPRWSKGCIGRELSPSEFEASPVTARGILVCVLRDIFQTEYRDSGNNEAIAVRRVAAWWMTGDPSRYNSTETAPYTQNVLSFYQQQNPPGTTQQQTTPRTTTPSQPQNAVYDRYMRAGYAATQQKDYETALLYFKRALDERPNDTFATQAIRNVENYRTRRQEGASGTNQTAVNSIPQPRQPQQQAASTSIAAITQEQAIALIERWSQAKQQVFAPPFSQRLVDELTTGELHSALVEPDGVLAWLQNNQAYYRFGVQKVESIERFATSDNRATLEVEVTEDRTLYQDGRVNSDQTSFETERIRYTLEFVDGNWKVADYKSVNGSLLERAVLDTATSSGGTQ